MRAAKVGRVGAMSSSMAALLWVLLPRRLERREWRRSVPMSGTAISLKGSLYGDSQCWSWSETSDGGRSREQCESLEEQNWMTWNVDGERQFRTDGSCHNVAVNSLRHRGKQSRQMCSKQGSSPAMTGLQCKASEKI